MLMKPGPDHVPVSVYTGVNVRPPFVETSTRFSMRCNGKIWCCLHRNSANVNPLRSMRGVTRMLSRKSNPEWQNHSWKAVGLFVIGSRPGDQTSTDVASVRWDQVAGIPAVKPSEKSTFCPSSGAAESTSRTEGASRRSLVVMVGIRGVMRGGGYSGSVARLLHSAHPRLQAVRTPVPSDDPGCWHRLALAIPGADAGPRDRRRPRNPIGQGRCRFGLRSTTNCAHAPRFPAALGVAGVATRAIRCPLTRESCSPPRSREHMVWGPNPTSPFSPGGPTPHLDANSALCRVVAATGRETATHACS